MRNIVFTSCVQLHGCNHAYSYFQNAFHVLRNSYKYEAREVSAERCYGVFTFLELLSNVVDSILIVALPFYVGSLCPSSYRFIVLRVAVWLIVLLWHVGLK